MFLDNYPCTTSQFGHSIIYKGLASAPAILLIHGYSGIPHSLSWLGKQLNEAGYTVYIPRLPGHGTNAKDFTSSTWKDWVRRVCDAYIDISAIHEHVFVAGHSMGGLLASILAARFNPEKLILFAPAFEITAKRVWLTPFVKFFVKKMSNTNKPFYTSPEYLKAQSDYIGVTYIDKIADFYKLKKLAHKNLEYVKAETLIVLSHKDQTVPLEVQDILNSKLKSPKEYLLLQESSHTVTDDIEREQVAKKVIAFLKG